MSKKINPCVLLLSDIHVSKDNIPEFTVNWQEALAVCDRMNIQEIVFGGDMFMSRSAQTLDVLLAVHDALLAAAKRGVNVTLAMVITIKSIRKLSEAIAMYSTSMITSLLLMIR
ncbi:hypothetical protein [Bacteroides thetaiotaomicron]|uniref:hypothetical protein n=1 Tax=Bacteroides thetaiotaomicron TaxID=818 RepID=UPI0039C36B33